MVNRMRHCDCSLKVHYTKQIHNIENVDFSSRIFYILYAFHSVEMCISSLLITSTILDAVNLSLFPKEIPLKFKNFLNMKCCWNEKFNARFILITYKLTLNFSSSVSWGHEELNLESQLKHPYNTSLQHYSQRFTVRIQIVILIHKPYKASVCMCMHSHINCNVIMIKQ